jgi:hypothetical protein
MAIESPEYEATRLRLMADPIVREMAIGCLLNDPAALAHEDGTPRHEFMLAALREYEARAGHPAECHIGGVAEAILRLLAKPDQLRRPHKRQLGCCAEHFNEDGPK